MPREAKSPAGKSTRTTNPLAGTLAVKGRKAPAGDSGRLAAITRAGGATATGADADGSQLSGNRRDRGPNPGLDQGPSQTSAAKLAAAAATAQPAPRRQVPSACRR